MISSCTIDVMAAIFSRLNVRPVVVIAGNKCHQHLQTVDSRTSATTSIINDHTFNAVNVVHHTLYQQFCITDPDYASFLDCIRFTQLTQQWVDWLQEGIALCPLGLLPDNQIWQAYTIHADATVMTVSRRGAQWVNNIVVDHLFSRIRPLSNIPCSSVAECDPIFPHLNMQVIFTENRDKQSPVVNGQEALILSCKTEP